jgi:N-acetylglutamate synthase-like GNAT family acetyltransferase
MIRQFRSEDAPACCSLIRACLESDLSLSLTLRRKMVTAETPQSMNERARLFYVAVYEEQNRIAGIAGLDLNEIRLLCVLPDCQRAGIGRALLEHLKSMAPSPLFTDIFVYSSIQAAGFYKVCGFSEKGAFTFDFCGEPLPTIFMSRQWAVGHRC